MDYKKVSAALVAATTVAALLLAGSGGAVAQVNNFDIAGDAVTSDDGSIDSLTVGGDGSFTFNGVDAPADRVVTIVEVKNPDGSWSTIAKDVTKVSGHAGTVEGPIGADVLANSQWTKAALASNTDGQAATTKLKFSMTVEVVDTDGNTLASDYATTKAGITVTNEAVSTGANANGALNGSATNQSP